MILALTAFLSGWFHGTVLSISVLSVLAGLVLAGAGVLQVDPGAAIVVFIVELALVLTLFTDGLYAERELLREEWHAPARALVIAMPITLVTEAFLLGAVLAPTDPVVTSRSTRASSGWASRSPPSAWPRSSTATASR